MNGRLAATLDEDGMAAIESASPDSLLEAALDELLASHWVVYRKTLSRTAHSGPVVSYSIGIRPDLDLALSFTVVLDQMEVSFDGCVLVVEEAAYMSRGRTSESSRADWRRASHELARDIIRSPLRTEIRWLGSRTLGGYLYRFEDGTWRCCGGGGSIFMCLGKLHVNHYEDWLLKDKPNER